MNLEFPDPRGISREIPSDPARRLTVMATATVVLVDNGKLAAGTGAFDSIPAALVAQFGLSHWRIFSRDLLRYHHSQLARVIDEIAALKPDAAVFALGDAGVSVQTMLAAIGLEQRGIPTVVLATALGAPACKAIAQPRLPALPVVVLDIVRADAAEKIEAAIAHARPEIEAALTRAQTAPAASLPATGALVFHPQSDGWHIVAEFQDWLAENELGDGLPLLPPQAGQIEALLATVPDDADDVLYESALTSGRSLRVRDAAVNAAMTGCPTAAFPVVVAALKAIALPDFRLLQAAITTHPSGYFVILSGCEPARFGMSGGPGCLGPGHRGNLAVGRTVSLAVQHLFGARPGGADLTIFGSPAEIAYCLAEDISGFPWPPLAAERGFDGPAVFVVKAEAPRNAMEALLTTPAAICATLAEAATAPCSNNAYIPGDLAVMINPEHARIFTDAGWTRRDVAQAIHNRARLPRRLLEGRGILPIRPSYMDALDELPVTRSPDDIQIVVAGAPGPHSLVALPWGFSRGQWVEVSAR
jgi:hypothetical protein